MGTSGSTLPAVREAIRLRAWAMAEQGFAQSVIARALGVSKGAVSQWLKAARLHGEAALRAKPIKGPTAKLTSEQVETVLAALRHGADRHNFIGNFWTTERVARLIKRLHKVSYHPSHVSRLLRQWGWSVQQPERRAKERREAEIQTWRETTQPAIEKKRSTRSRP
jgi:transposase